MTVKKDLRIRETANFETRISRNTVRPKYQTLDSNLVRPFMFVFFCMFCKVYIDCSGPFKGLVLEPIIGNWNS